MRVGTDMAIRFPKVYPEEKEIIAPDDWNRNLAEYVDELNGRIDADNLRSTSAITKSIVKQNAFQELFSSTHAPAESFAGSSTHFSLSNGFVGWQSLDVDGNEMPWVQFEANADGWLICEANASWYWGGNGVQKSDVLDSSGAVSGLQTENPFRCSTHEDYKASHTNRGRPPGGWMGTSQGLRDHGADGTGYYTGYGDLVQTSGGAGVTAFYPSGLSSAITHGNFPQGRWEDHAVDYYAFKLRIVVDGEPVSESGWIHVGNYKCGTFLCGATPITAGYHKVSLEARAALLADLRPSRKGIGVKKGGAGKTGKYTSRVTRTTYGAPTAMPVQDGNYGISCKVKDRNLLVSYRKH